MKNEETINKDDIPACLLSERRKEETSLTSAANSVSCEDALFIAMELGERILHCGGEIGRVEDTIRRICLAYGAVNVDVIAILSMIVLTVDFGGETLTSSRRVEDIGKNNLGMLSGLNDLSRKICATRPTKEEVMVCIDKIDKRTKIGTAKKLIGFVLISMGFAVFFGGSIIDAAFSGLIAVPMCLLLTYLTDTKLNNIIARFVVCFVGGICAMLVGKTGIKCDVNTIMIGDIMNVVPGVALTNSFRDLFGGDVMSGLFRLCTALLDAVAIAGGYGVAVLIFGGAV